jgi:hypothetical protein
MVAAESGENCDLEPGIDGNTDLAALLQESLGKGEDRGEEFNAISEAIVETVKEAIRPSKDASSETLTPKAADEDIWAEMAKSVTARGSRYKSPFGLQPDGTYVIPIHIPENFLEPLKEAAAVEGLALESWQQMRYEEWLEAYYTPAGKR